jgi:uroporphyrinogen-III decarboxylase
MDNVPEKYKARNQKTMELVTETFDFKNVDDAPIIMNSANYFLFGYPESEIPDDYFTNPEIMYNRQVGQFNRHFDLVEDNYVPYLMPWFGTGVLASGFGMNIISLPKMDPTTDPIEFVVKDPADIKKLKMPDPHKDGFMPKVLNQIKFFQNNSDIPINFTDNHGPLTTAVQILGYEKLFYWLHDYPKEIHYLMDLLSDAVIAWVKVQKELIGEPLDECIGNQGVPVAKGTGVWFSDDDAVLLSPEMYREFVAPYNNKIMKAFGTGIVHYCGCANQHIETFLDMKYLKGINTFSLGDAETLLELKSKTEDRIVIIACDFTPVDYEQYYKTLFEENNMSKKGLVLQSLFAPTTGVKNKSYELLDRDECEVLPKLSAVLNKYLRA